MSDISSYDSSFFEEILSLSPSLKWGNTDCVSLSLSLPTSIICTRLGIRGNISSSSSVRIELSDATSKFVPTSYITFRGKSLSKEIVSNCFSKHVKHGQSFKSSAPTFSGEGKSSRRMSGVGGAGRSAGGIFLGGGGGPLRGNPPPVTEKAAPLRRSLAPQRLSPPSEEAGDRRRDPPPQQEPPLG